MQRRLPSVLMLSALMLLSCLAYSTADRLIGSNIVFTVNAVINAEISRLLAYAAAMIVFLPYLLLSGNREQWYLEKSTGKMRAAVAFLALGALFAINMVFSGMSDSVSAEKIKEFLIKAVLGTAVVPLLEEILFRRFFLRSMLDIKIRSWICIAVQALLFMSVHLPSGIEAAVFAFAGGIAFGYAYVISGSIVLPYIMHALYNGILYLYLYVTRYTDVQKGTAVTVYIIISAALILSGAVLLAVYRKKGGKNED